MKQILISALLLTISVGSHASVILEYTGALFDRVSTPINTPPIYTTASRVTGWIELPERFAPFSQNTIVPASFSFSDGVNTISDPGDINPFSGGFFFFTDNMGLPANWWLLMNFNNIAAPSGGTTFGIQIRANINTSGGSDSVFFQSCTSSTSNFCPVDPKRVFQSANSSVAGTWLYREAPVREVPNPATLALLALGLLGMRLRHQS